MYIRIIRTYIHTYIHTYIPSLCPSLPPSLSPSLSLSLSHAYSPPGTVSARMQGGRERRWERQPSYAHSTL